MFQGVKRAAILTTVVSIGCGGSEKINETPSSFQDPYQQPSTVSEHSESYMVDGEYTVEVDDASLTSSAPVSTEFLPDTPKIFFLGKLAGIPVESEIEVRWSRSTQGEPFHATRAIGSGDYTVLSHISPKREELSEGEYWTIVTVNGRDVGKRSFRITNRRSGGMMRVKQLEVALSVDDKHQAVSPSKSLPKGIEKVYASFFVSGVETGATIRVKWYRGEDNLIEEADIESEGEKRYSSALSQKKLPIGDYSVEIEVEGEVFAQRSFYIGDSSGQTIIEKAALGTKLGKKQLPTKARQSFKAGTKTIKCGIQFAYIPDGSKIEVSWVSMATGQEDTLHTSKVDIKKGGYASVGLGWNPGKKLTKGAYKAVVLVNDVKRTELPFTVD